jgi:hypothetical protein
MKVTVTYTRTIEANAEVDFAKLRKAARADEAVYGHLLEIPSWADIQGSGMAGHVPAGYDRVGPNVRRLLAGGEEVSEEKVEIDTLMELEEGEES